MFFSCKVAEERDEIPKRTSEKYGRETPMAQTAMARVSLGVFNSKGPGDLAPSVALARAHVEHSRPVEVQFVT